MGYTWDFITFKNLKFVVDSRSPYPLPRQETWALWVDWNSKFVFNAQYHFNITLHVLKLKNATGL